MRITYDIIIEYLCNIPESDYTFLTKPNIIKFINDNRLKNFFRMGMLVYNKKDKNISLMSSILFLLDKNFMYSDTLEKINIIEKYLNDMRNYWNTKYKNNKQLSKIDGINLIFKYQKGELEEKLTQFLEVISFCLNINIVKFNFKNKKETIYYYNKLNPYKPTIFLANYNNFWEPIYTSEIKIFNLIEKKFNFLLKDKEILSLDEVLIKEKLKEKYNNAFISKKELEPILKKSKLNKMKKQELLDLANNLNIFCNNKNTKKIIIEKILNN